MDLHDHFNQLQLIVQIGCTIQLWLKKGSILSMNHISQKESAN